MPPAHHSADDGAGSSRSLGVGASGVRLPTLQLLEAMLTRNLLPVVPAQGSVGASGDLAPLAHMSATMIGVGEILVDGVARPAAEALDAAGSSQSRSVRRKGSRC